MTYTIGDLVRISGAFKDVNGVYADPSTTVLRVLKPDGTTELTPALIHDALGKFHADVSADKSGRWNYRFTGTGVVQAAAEGRFDVQKSQFTNP